MGKRVMIGDFPCCCNDALEPCAENAVVLSSVLKEMFNDLTRIDKLLTFINTDN